jgi:DNA-binding Lrp family transcriptional regulator
MTDGATRVGLDELDRHIVDLLHRDGRRSVSSVARALGVTNQTVTRRLERLLKSDAIRITARVDPVALGVPLFCNIGVRVKPGATNRVAEQLAAMEHVAWVGCSTGSFDILVEVFLPDTDAVFEFLDQRLAEMPDIVATKEWLVLRSAKYEYLWGDDGTDESPDAAKRDASNGEPVRGWTTRPGSVRELVRVDDLDRAVIRLLREDGRRPFADIARNVKVAEGTVASRVDRLLSTGAMLVIAHLNWPAIGYPVHVNVGIKVTRGQVVQVGERLATLPNVSYVGYPTGDFDIIAEAFLPDNASLLEFIDVDVAAIPAVESIETWHVLRVTKVNYEWEGEKISRRPLA